MEEKTLNQKNHTKNKIQASRIKRKVFKHVTIIRSVLLGALLLFIILIGVVGYKFYKAVDAPFYFGLIYNFATQPVGGLPAHDNRTNILVMGKAGGEHDGPDLTDTIMVVSIGLTANDIKIVSVPRDTWIPEMRAKINSAYYWGKQKGVGGINFAKAEVSQVVGLPLHYGVVINFDGFKEIIDTVGGIDVQIENSFTDNLYPIAGRENDNCGGRDPYYLCRYETLTFNAGTMHMDGTTALKFVRSRHAEGLEGTDLAREARQARVIEALKNKLSDKNTYLDYKTDKKITEVVLKNIETDVDYPSASILARRVYESRDSIKSFVIPVEYLLNPKPSAKYDMQSVFVPRTGNWEEINTWIKSIL